MFCCFILLKQFQVMLNIDGNKRNMKSLQATLTICYIEYIEVSKIFMDIGEKMQCNNI